MAPPYLVLFVADPADDGHANAIREAVRVVPGAGFFDDPAALHDGQRTVGAFLRTEDPAGADASALLAVIGAVSFTLAARFEVQYREDVLGWIVDGRPDPAVRAALDLPEPRDIPEAP